MKVRYLIVALILLSFISLFIGVKDITPLDLLDLTDDKVQIMLQSRFPRLVTIIIAGVVMSIGGLIMQQLSRNKFVSPTTAGTMDSARLGLLVALILFPTAALMQKMLIAFVFALVGTFIIYEDFGKSEIQGCYFYPIGRVNVR